VLSILCTQGKEKRNYLKSLCPARILRFMSQRCCLVRGQQRGLMKRKGCVCTNRAISRRHVLLSSPAASKDHTCISAVACRALDTYLMDRASVGSAWCGAAFHLSFDYLYVVLVSPHLCLIALTH